MKTRMLFVLITSVFVFHNLQSQNLRKHYSPELNVSGDWEIDLLRSHSTEDGGIFFTKLSFVEDLNELTRIQEKIHTCTLKQQLQLGLDSLGGYRIVGVGRVKALLRLTKLDTTHILTNQYALVRSGGILNLVLFPQDEQMTSEFGKFLIFEIANDFKSATKEMQVVWTMVRSEYILIKVEKGATQSYSPQIRNKNKVLNREGLFGQVRSTITKTFQADKMASGYVSGSELIDWVRVDFNKNGEMVKVTFLSPEEQFNSYTIKGNYNNTLSIADRPNPYQADSIRVTRTNDTEIENYYNSNSPFKLKTSLVNGQVSKSMVVESTNNREDIYSYNKKGDVESIKTKTTDYEENKYYLYISYDLQGNWTKRVSMQRAGNQKPDFVEVRQIEYY